MVSADDRLFTAKLASPARARSFEWFKLTEIYRWTIQRLRSSSQLSDPPAVIWAYVFTVLAVVVATAVRYLVDPLLGESSQFATYLKLGIRSRAEIVRLAIVKSWLRQE